MDGGCCCLMCGGSLLFLQTHQLSYSCTETSAAFCAIKVLTSGWPLGFPSFPELRFFFLYGSYKSSCTAGIFPSISLLPCSNGAVGAAIQVAE